MNINFSYCVHSNASEPKFTCLEAFWNNLFQGFSFHFFRQNNIKVHYQPFIGYRPLHDNNYYLSVLAITVISKHPFKQKKKKHMDDQLKCIAFGIQYTNIEMQK